MSWSVVRRPDGWNGGRNDATAARPSPASEPAGRHPPVVVGPGAVSTRRSRPRSQSEHTRGRGGVSGRPTGVRTEGGRPVPAIMCRLPSGTRDTEALLQGMWTARVFDPV
jgi:hypothetical protein